MIRKLVLGLMIALAILMVTAGWTVYRVWKGDPLPIAGAMPAHTKGTLYWVAPDTENGGFSVWEQPANMTVSPTRTSQMTGCSKERCELYWMDVIDGEVQYVVFDMGLYLWRGENREVSPKGFSREIKLPAGVESIDGTIYVNGKPVLVFEGESGPKFSVGYYPRALSPDSRYLVFYYPGYTSSDRWFLAHFLDFEERQRGNYAIDVETKAIYRLPDGTHLRWK